MFFSFMIDYIKFVWFKIAISCKDNFYIWRGKTYLN